jgi:hypothetical protein
VWNSKGVHHAARTGGVGCWGVGKAGQGGAMKVQQREEKAEVRGEARGGGAGFDRKKCGP